jgi:RNA-directed DNA polymerase
MEKNHRNKPFARYADDAVAHCRSREEAEELLKSLETRFAECGLELHPTKTRIVYCKDDNRQGNYTETTFDFLGYTFRARRSKNRYGEFFINFTPAVSNKAKKAMQQKIHDWCMQLKPNKTLEDVAYRINPILRGWINYYGRFYKSEMYSVLKHVNRALVRWARNKYKKLATHQRRATAWLGRIARREQKLFVQWQMGFLPEAG